MLKRIKKELIKLKIKNKKMNGSNSTFLLFSFLLIYLIDYIFSENINNGKDIRNIIELKLKGKDFQKIMGSKLFPDLIYLNGNETSIDNLGRIFIKSENENEISKVTLIWKQKINTCYNLFRDSIGIIGIDLSNFDTSIVTSMNSMFYNCMQLEYINFGNFNTSSVLDMSHFLFNCISLTSLDLSRFDTSSVKLMNYMFCKCHLLTSLDITNFNTSKVVEIKSMFYECHSLLKIDLSYMDVSKVTNMEYLFRECLALTSLSLNNLNTSNTISMQGLFLNCSLLKKIEITNLDTSKVEDMSFMFHTCKSLKSLDLTNFVTSKVENMNYMFYNCISLTSLNLTNFDTSKVENMNYMFCQCKSLSYIDISNFDTMNVNSMTGMFFGCSSLKTLDLSNFYLLDVDMGIFLELCTSLEYVKFPSDYENVAYGFAMLSECNSLKSIDLYMFSFYGDIGYLFSECYSLTSLDLSLVDTSQVTQMYNVFEKCYLLKSLDLSNWKTSQVKNIVQIFYDCKSLTSIDLSNFDTSLVTNMEGTFFNCIKITSLNLSKFYTSFVENMNSMFYGCISLKSLNLSGFNTLNVKNMKSMFFNCHKLESLDLSNFNTSNVENMGMMFSGCLNLKFIDFKNFEKNLELETSNIFYETNNNLRIYMDNIQVENINNLIPELSDNMCITNNYSMIYINNIKITNDNKICLDDCFNNKIYRYEYQNFCYNQCPKETVSSSSDIYKCEISKIECIEEYPFLRIEENYCSDYCDIEDFFNDKCIISNYNIESHSALIINIINEIEDGSMDKFLTKYINKEGKDLIKKVNNAIYQITTSFNQKNIDYQNLSLIDLGECENIIKEKYIIPMNETLLIFKTEKYIEGLLIPFIEYEIFNEKSKEILNLNECKDRNIRITINIPVSINESIIYKFDLNSSYYNDICINSEENGIDITLYDRKNEYINNNLYLCTINCTYIGYNKDNKTVTCLCQVKPGIILYTDINKEKIINSITNIKRQLNLNVMKCYNLVFSKESLIINFGNYIILSIILLFICSAIFFYFKGYDSLCNEINEILNEKDINIKNKLKFEEKVKENSTSKTKVNFDKKKDNKSYEFKLSVDLNISNDTLENKEKIEIEKNENEKPIEYLSYEMNMFPYEEARQNDKRTYFQYYKSLLLINNIVIFSFYSNKDYNPYIIKICIFFFLFASNLVVNALFFNDHIMHEIYKDKGAYNFFCLLPQIIYSVLISSIIDIIIKNSVLSQRNILEIKHEKNEYNLKHKIIIVIKCLIIKFVCFYIITFLLLILFWYYISCFSIVYKNTQKHLFINSLIGLLISFIYPFIFCLLPGILRIPSLKWPGKFLYKISMIIQIL